MFTPEEITRLRKALGMTPAQFALALGVSENTARRWEIGDRHPRYKMMEIINKLAKKAPQSAATP